MQHLSNGDSTYTESLSRPVHWKFQFASRTRAWHSWGDFMMVFDIPLQEALRQCMPIRNWTM